MSSRRPIGGPPAASRAARPARRCCSLSASPHSLTRSALPYPSHCSIWDDGTANPEPALDQFTMVSKYGALGWLAGGLSIFAVVGTWAKLSQPEKNVPWVRPPA